MAHVHHPSPEERRKRLNLWVVFVVVLVLIGVAALALVLLLDDDESSGRSSTTTTTVEPTTPEQYAQALYAKWKANDRAGATQYASPEAIEQLFSVPYVPAQTPDGPKDPLQLSGCEGAAGAVVCTWTGELEQLVMTVRNTTGGLPVLVVEVQRTGG